MPVWVSRDVYKRQALDDAIGYAGLAAYAGALEEQYGADRVTLVDAGDAIQGQAVGTLSQGEYIISLMNAAGYDLSLIHISGRKPRRR